MGQNSSGTRGQAGEGLVWKGMELGEAITEQHKEQQGQLKDPGSLLLSGGYSLFQRPALRGLSWPGINRSLSDPGSTQATQVEPSPPSKCTLARHRVTAGDLSHHTCNWEINL